MIRVERLTGPALSRALGDVARLRIEVFRAWPYLYDGDAAYEEAYLQTYRDSENAILVGAFDGDRLIGASTGTPMEDHAEDFAAAFAGQDIPLGDIFYCAESVLLPEYRGHGIGHAFFDAREDHAARWAMGMRPFAGSCGPPTTPCGPAITSRSIPSGANAAMRRLRARWRIFPGRTSTRTPRPITPCNSWMRRL